MDPIITFVCVLQANPMGAAFLIILLHLVKAKAKVKKK